MENKSGYLIRMFSLYGCSCLKTLTGILLMVGFCIFGPAIDVFVKLAGNADIPVFQIAASRFALQALFLLPFALYYGLLRWPNRVEAGLHLLRGLLILVATSFFFAALKYMPIADAFQYFLSNHSF